MSNTITNKTLKVGDSLFIIIPKHIRKTLEINEGDEVEYQIIKKVNEIITIKCPSCNSYFSNSKLDVYDCPICGRNEILSSEGEVVE